MMFMGYLSDSDRTFPYSGEPTVPCGLQRHATDKF
ncbi:hypothetical protein OF001_U40163 [Pseudomonas sp. OF001]|nr:hypothetical protein OF001_U40163 [Pseudomonas sp. OF001]